MLAGLTPSVEITGGPWFTDNELDIEFVDMLKKCATKLLQDKVSFFHSSICVLGWVGDGCSRNRTWLVDDVPWRRLTSHNVSQSIPDKNQIFPTAMTPYLPTVKDVKDFISSLKVAAVELMDEHVESLLDLMVYDGTVEKIMVLNVVRNGNGEKKRKRKGLAGATSDASDVSDDDAPKKKKRKSTKEKATAAKGKGKKAVGKAKAAGKKRKLAESDSEGSSDAEFDSDEDVETARNRAKEAGTSKKRRKERRKRKGAADSDDSATEAEAEDSDAGVTSDSSKGSDEEDEDDKPDAEAANPNDFVYRLIRPYHPRIGWTDMPCGKCPVEAFCSEAARPMGAHHSDRSSTLGMRPKDGGAGPKVPIEMSGMLQGVGMMGGVGAAIGASNERWGEVKSVVGFGVAPVNPRDCTYFQNWLDF